MKTDSAPPPRLTETFEFFFSTVLPDNVLTKAPAPKKRTPSHYHIVLAHALYDLNSIVNGGEEFPDAAYRKAQQYNVDQHDLEQLYDAQFN